MENVPVASVIDKELELFVLRLYGRVTEGQVLDAVASLSTAMAHSGSYRSLLMFSRMVDLSELDTASLNAIRTETKAIYRRLDLRRRAAAAVVDSAHDAAMIMPLWNALSEADPDLDLHYELFDAIEPALEWLEIPTEQGQSVIARTEP